MQLSMPTAQMLLGEASVGPLFPPVPPVGLDPLGQIVQDLGLDAPPDSLPLESWPTLAEMDLPTTAATSLMPSVGITWPTSMLQ